MLPFDIEEGKDYITKNGEKIVSLTYIKPSNVWMGWAIWNCCPVTYGTRGVFDPVKCVNDVCDIIMPAETWGVYHVSDGDTPLKAALERWVTSGGKAEVKYTHKPQWVTASGSYINSHDDSMMCRAAGCTEDREFPQPKPKMQMREGAWYQRRDGNISVAPADCNEHSDAFFVAFDDGQFDYDPNGVSLYDDDRMDIVAEIDPPQPPAPQPDWRSKPVTCGDMYDHHATYGRFDEANWWQQRAQQDSRP